MLLRPPRVTRTYNSFPTLRSSDLLGSALAALIAPSVAEAGIVLDTVEVVVDVAELLANPLDEGPHVGPVAVRPVAGDEVLAAHDVVDLAVGDVAALLRHQEQHDGKLGQREDDLVRSEEHTSELQSLMRNSYAVFW